jgi:Tfp pilus assembly protein PilN
MDILKDENTALLNVIKQIEQEYEDADKTCFNDTRMFDRLLGQIPDRIWVE